MTKSSCSVDIDPAVSPRPRAPFPESPLERHHPADRFQQRPQTVRRNRARPGRFPAMSEIRHNGRISPRFHPSLSPFVFLMTRFSLFSHV
jgi:hypothetical protein